MKEEGEKKEGGRWYNKRPELRACGCKHTYQDLKYGIGRRLHNWWKGGLRCTVCKHEINV